MSHTNEQTNANKNNTYIPSEPTIYNDIKSCQNLVNKLYYICTHCAITDVSLHTFCLCDTMRYTTSYIKSKNAIAAIT